MHLKFTNGPRTLSILLAGEWSIKTLPLIESEVQAVSFESVKMIEIDARQIVISDISAAWLIHDLEMRARAAGLTTSYAGNKPVAVQLVSQTLVAPVDNLALDESPESFQPITALGHQITERIAYWISGPAFIGELSMHLVRSIMRPRHWKPISIARHLYETGITAVPIVALIAFLISVITAYMGAQQLRKFGADIFVVDLVTVGVLREMGVLLTAIIVAGRSGSAFAAEIGAMRLNEEVDALEATGVNAIQSLVLPRCIGLVIAMPLLTIIADIVGLVGGAVLCHTLLDMPLTQYVQRVNESIAPSTFWVGLIKAPVFALLIAAAGTYRGMQVRSSSRELGRLTTVAVVQSIFLVILADAIFAVIFMELDL